MQQAYQNFLGAQNDKYLYFSCGEVSLKSDFARSRGDELLQKFLPLKYS